MPTQMRNFLFSKHVSFVYSCIFTSFSIFHSQSSLHSITLLVKIFIILQLFRTTFFYSLHFPLTPLHIERAKNCIQEMFCVFRFICFRCNAIIFQYHLLYFIRIDQTCLLWLTVLCERRREMEDKTRYR